MDERLVPKRTWSQRLRLRLCRPLPCKTTQQICSQCRHSLDSETLSEHSVDCFYGHQKTADTNYILNDLYHVRSQEQASLCITLKTAHLTHHNQLKSHKHFPHMKKLTFSSIIFHIALILSLFSLSSAHKPLPWDLWSIEDSTATQTPDHANVFNKPSLQIPDLVAVAGHLFSYQVSPTTTSIQYQAREAGMHALPQWLYFNHTSATFAGVPLSSNKGKVYITLEVHVRGADGSVVVTDTLFSIDVHVLHETRNTPSPLEHYNDTRPRIPSDDGTNNCQPNYYVQDIPPYPQCLETESPVLASLVTIVNFTLFSGGQRAALLSTISEAIGICPSRLFVNAVNWTSRDGMELWKQLAESGIVDYLDSSTIFSFQLSCSSLDYQNAATVTSLYRLDQYLTEQPQGIKISSGSKKPVVVPCIRWFVSTGSTVIVSSPPATVENHARLRRQMDDVIVNQPIEMVATTTIPNVVSSSVVVSSSPGQPSLQSSTGTAIASQSVLPTVTTSITSGFSSISPTATLPRSGLPSSFPMSERVSSTTIIESSSVLPITTSSQQFTATSAVSTLSSSSEADTSSVARTSVSVDQSTFISTLSSIALSSQIVVPPSRVVPTSEISRTFQPTMLPATPTIQTVSTATTTTHSLPFVTSMDGTSMQVLPSTSVPVLTMMFSMQSVLTSMPILSESLTPIRSSPPSSILFSIQSSIETILSSTLQPPITTTTVSLPSISFSLPDSFVPTPTPSTSIVSSSPTLVLSTSIPLMSESTSMLLPLETTISSLFVEPTPTSIPLMSESTSMLLPLETTISSLFVEPTPTSIPSMSESTSILLPFETTLSSPFREPTPILSSTLFIQPSTSSILLPETTALSSEVTQASISMLMPMSSAELTLSISIFTPSPTPTISTPEPTETFMSSLPFESQSDIIFPTSSSVFFSSPVPSSIISSIGRPQTSLLITSSDILLPETSTPGPEITPQLTSIFSSSPTTLFPSPSFQASSSVEISPTMSTISMLLPMDSSDMTLSMSIFTPSPSALLPSETFIFTTSVMFTTELATETMIFSTLFPTPETSFASVSSAMPSQSFSEVVSLIETTSMIDFFPTSTPVFMTTMIPTPETSSSMSSAIPSQSFPQTVSFIDTSMEFFPTSTPAEVLPMLTSSFTTPSISSEEPPFMVTTSAIFFSSPVVVTSTMITLIMPTLSTAESVIEVTPTPTLTSFMPMFSTAEPSVDVTSLTDFFPTSTPVVATLTLTSMFTSFVPTPSPSPGPESFCEVNNINCGNGICLDVNDTFECVCFPDFTGKNCEEIIDDCNPLPCNVNGTSNCTDGNTTFICTCASGYTGLLCEDEIDSCLSSPCQNSEATCLHLGVGEFVCLCPEGFSGELCETDIDPCSPNPCEVNESCIIEQNGNFTCIEVTTSSSVSIEPTSFTIDLSSSQVFTQDTISDFTTPFPPSIVTSITSQTISTTPSFSRSETVSSPLFTVIETPTTTSPSIEISSRTTLEMSIEISTTEPTETLTSRPTESSVTMTHSSSSSMSFTTTMLTSSSSVITQLPSSSTFTPIPSTTMTTQLPSVSTSMPSPSTIRTTMISPSSTVPSVTPSASPVNLSPMLLNPIGTLIVNRGQFFQYSIPEATFYDPEMGTTSALSLSLLDFRGIPLPNTTWIQLQQGIIEGLPLEAELINEAITEHLFILRAQDGAGSSAHDFITLRVLPLGPFSTFLIVPFDNAYEQFNQNLSQKLNLVQRLASYTDPPESTDIIYVNELRNESMLAISYKNLSIADLNCAEFYQWVETIYNNEEYTQRFIAAMEPAFIPTPTPRIEGTCSMTSTNIPPTLSTIDDIESATISNRVLLLSTVVPAAAVALCCFLVGICALCMYRRYRSERKYLTSRTLYCNRRPIILEGEIDLPEHRRRPVILANESALQGAGLLEEYDHDSDSSEDELLCLPPGDRERLLQRPDPPGYRLPPIYAHRLPEDDLYDR